MMITLSEVTTLRNNSVHATNRYDSDPKVLGANTRLSSLHSHSFIIKKK